MSWETPVKTTGRDDVDSALDLMTHHNKQLKNTVPSVFHIAQNFPDLVRPEEVRLNHWTKNQVTASVSPTFVAQLKEKLGAKALDTLRLREFAVASRADLQPYHVDLYDQTGFYSGDEASFSATIASASAT